MQNLSVIIRSWRYAERLTVRDAAKILGTSAPTLSRIEHGEGCDGVTLAKILKWIMA
jgi:transcriptional regulator with XRE-family HTH domain